MECKKCCQINYNKTMISKGKSEKVLLRKESNRKYLIILFFASWDDVKSNRESTVQHTHDSCQKLEPGSVLLRTARSETYANEKGSSTDTLTKDISGRLDHSNWYIILSLIILDLILDHSFLSFRHYFLHTNVCFNIIIIIIIIDIKEWSFVARMNKYLFSVYFSAKDM